MLDAINLAGGFDVRANRANVKIARTVGIHVEILTVNTELPSQQSASAIPIVLSGDLIFVPQLLVSARTRESIVAGY